MKTYLNAVVLWAVTTSSGVAAESGRLTAVPIQQVVIEDEFWSPKFKGWYTQVRGD